MRYLVHFILFFSLLFLVSCAEEREKKSEGLSITVGGRPIILPFKTVDCYSEEVAGAFFRLFDFEINWSRTNADLFVYSLRFEIRSASLDSDFVQVFDPESLERFMVLSSGTPVVGGQIPSTPAGDASAVIRETCSRVLEGGGVLTRPGNLTISGLKLREGVRRFTAQVKVSLLGVAVGNSSENQEEETPVRASTTFSVFYDF